MPAAVSGSRAIALKLFALVIGPSERARLPEPRSGGFQLLSTVNHGRDCPATVKLSPKRDNRQRSKVRVIHVKLSLLWYSYQHATGRGGAVVGPSLLAPRWLPQAVGAGCARVRATIRLNAALKRFPSLGARNPATWTHASRDAPTPPRNLPPSWYESNNGDSLTGESACFSSYLLSHFGDSLTGYRSPCPPQAGCREAAGGRGG